MIAYLLLVLFASQILGIDASLAPGLSVKNVLLYVTFFALALDTAVTRRRKLELMPVFAPFVLYAIYATLSWALILIVIHYPGYRLMESLIALKGGPVEELFVLLIFFYGVDDERHALWLLRWMLWLIILANIFTIVDSLDIPDLGYMSLDDGRIAGYTGNATSFAALLVCFLPAIIVTFRTTTGILKLLAAIGVFASSLALVLTVARSAILGLGIAGLFGAYYLRASIPPRVIIRAGVATMFVCVIALIGAIAAGSWDLFVERFAAIGSNSFDATSGRNVIWTRALDKMIEHPVTFATGFGWYAYESSDYFSINTHNTYLTFLYNLGAFGVILFVIVVVNVLRIARAAVDRAGSGARPWIIALIFGFVSLLVTLMFMNFASWIYVWSYVGVTLRLAVLQADNESTVVRAKSNRIAVAPSGERRARSDVEN